MASKNTEWMNRAARRQNLELSMYRTQHYRTSDSKPETHSTPSPTTSNRKDSVATSPPFRAYSTHSEDPSSPSSSIGIQSTAASDLCATVPECGGIQLQTLLEKLASNNEEIEANSSRMRVLDTKDVKVSSGIQTRLKAVQGLNDRLRFLSGMLKRVDDCSRGKL